MSLYLKVSVIWLMDINRYTCLQIHNWRPCIIVWCQRTCNILFVVLQALAVIIWLIGLMVLQWTYMSEITCFIKHIYTCMDLLLFCFLKISNRKLFHVCPNILEVIWFCWLPSSLSKKLWLSYRICCNLAISHSTAEVTFFFNPRKQVCCWERG